MPSVARLTSNSMIVITGAKYSLRMFLLLSSMLLYIIAYTFLKINKKGDFMFCFNIKIAEVTFLIRANYLTTKVYFEDFLTNEKAEIDINVSKYEIHSFKKKVSYFTDEMCERGVLKYKIDRSLVNYGVFPLHASALSYHEDAYVFTALSGGGKSTHSRLWKETFGNDVKIINDDRPYLKVTEKDIYAFSHPQSGTHRLYTNTSCPVRVIGKIVKDKDNYVKRLSKADFFPFLVQQTFTMDDPNTTKKIISLIKKALDHVFLYEIHCNTNYDAASLIYEQIDKDIKQSKHPL